MRRLIVKSAHAVLIMPRSLYQKTFVKDYSWWNCSELPPLTTNRDKILKWVACNKLTRKKHCAHLEGKIGDEKFGQEMSTLNLIPKCDEKCVQDACWGSLDFIILPLFSTSSLIEKDEITTSKIGKWAAFITCLIVMFFKSKNQFPTIYLITWSAQWAKFNFKIITEIFFHFRNFFLRFLF